LKRFRFGFDGSFQELWFIEIFYFFQMKSLIFQWNNQTAESEQCVSVLHQYLIFSTSSWAEPDDLCLREVRYRQKRVRPKTGKNKTHSPAISEEITHSYLATMTFNRWPHGNYMNEFNTLYSISLIVLFMYAKQLLAMKIALYILHTLSK
jgi:hypothetical protein